MTQVNNEEPAAYKVPFALLQALLHAIGTRAAMELTPCGLTVRELLNEAHALTAQQDGERAEQVKAAQRAEIKAELLAEQQKEGGQS